MQPLPAPETAPETAFESTPDPADAAAARRALEAMRLGVVPTRALDAVSVGRDAELGTVDADLARAEADGGAVRAILGHYGTGKTHLLELVAQRALEAGFLVARAVLDPDETAPSHPRRVYRALVRSLRYPDRPTGRGEGLRPLLERAAASPEALAAFAADGCTGRPRDLLDQGAHLYLTPALRYLGALDAADASQHLRALVLDWLEGHPTVANRTIDDRLRRAVGRRGRIYCMKDFRPWARIYAYLLSGISALARRVGYQGLVILLDEAEFFDLLSRANQAYARTLFQALSWAALGDANGHMPFDHSLLDLGGYGVQRELPVRYDASPGLYVVLAMTPRTDGVDALHESVPAGAIVELGRLGAADYRELVARVVAHYRRARPADPPPERLEAELVDVVGQLLGNGYVANPRQAMKFIVEFLDLHYHRPALVDRAVADLREMYLFAGGRR